MNKTELIDLAKEICRRVDVAANGQRSTDNWSYADENLSAPDGMDYWDWIEQAEANLLEAIESIDINNM